MNDYIRFTIRLQLYFGVDAFCPRFSYNREGRLRELVGPKTASEQEYEIARRSTLRPAQRDQSKSSDIAQELRHGRTECRLSSDG